MGTQQNLENKMDEMLVKKAPFQIPENGRKAIVQYLPWIALVLGVLSLLGALGMWQTAHRVGDFADTLNQINRTYGGRTIDYGLVYYLAMTSLVVQGVLMLMAFKPLQNKLKKGWDLLLVSSLIGLVYSVLYLVSDSGGVGNFIVSIIGTIIGLYILAQIRSHYKGSVTKK